MRIVAYGVPMDAVDEYVRIGESTARKALHHFYRLSLKFLASITYGHPMQPM